MAAQWKDHRISILLIGLSVLLFWNFAYRVQRTDFTMMLIHWVVLFFLSYKLIQLNPNNWKLLGLAGLLFRVVFLLAIPNLSQDFYRFIWDGRMLLEGFNPYLSLPEVWIKQGNAPIAQAQELYTNMGQLNGSHYTNYPPVSQLCYLMGAMVASKSILGSAMVFRVLLILADVGTFFFGRKLLKALHLPEKQIFWYILNPFIIIELTGNLHFEAVMVFFIVWSLYLVHKGNWILGAVVLGLSVSVKLIPLLFLPLFFQRFMGGKHKTDQLPSNPSNLMVGFSKLTAFYCLVLVTALLTFAPFLSEAFFQNYKRTITLWFQTFEFNASIYYIVRWVGYQIVGWNVIATAGKILPLITLSILLGLTFLRNNKTTPQLIGAMVLGISAYYFLSTTVHPWYIAVPLALCVFTQFKFPIVWSFVIILSYTAYIHPDFKENLWMVGLEYFLVFGVLLWELFRKGDRSLNVQENI